MLRLQVKQCGDNHVIELPKNILDVLKVEIDDKLNLEVINQSIVLTKVEEELTFEELFKDYDGERFTTELQSFTSIGNEKW